MTYDPERDQEGLAVVEAALKRWESMEPVPFKMRRWDAYVLIGLLQFVSRADAIDGTPLQVAQAVGRQLQEVISDTAEIYALIQTGWDPALDVPQEPKSNKGRKEELGHLFIQGKIDLETYLKGISALGIPVDDTVEFAAQLLRWTEDSQQDDPAPVITPEAAAHVLHHFGESGGWVGSNAVTKLLEFLGVADARHHERLARAYPEYIAAYHLARSGSEGLDKLRVIANQDDDQRESTSDVIDPETRMEY